MRGLRVKPSPPSNVGEKSSIRLISVSLSQTMHRRGGTVLGSKQTCNYFSASEKLRCTITKEETNVRKYENVNAL